MREQTIRALDRINRRFYRSSGEEFSATRQTAWPAWDRVFDTYLASRPSEHGAHSILDLGCGNGRFAMVLDRRLEAEWSCLGVDASLSLLRQAQARSVASGSGRERLIATDVLAPHLPLSLDMARFDLIVAFGLMHHIPSWERRRSLLVSLADLLEPDGVLVVSFWQFAREERFVRRFMDWQRLRESFGVTVDLSDLERGDHLLRWGDGDALRYCHDVDPTEASELTSASGLRRLETFRGDGASGELNLYHLMQKPA